MAITIFHGEQIIASRQALTDMLSEAREQGVQIDSYDANQVKPGMIEEITADNDLFGRSRLVVIEGLYSEMRASKKRDQLIEMLGEAAAESEQKALGEGLKLVFWEKKTLTAAALKKFPQATIKLFKPPSLMWEFLDQLQPQMSSDQLNKFQSLFGDGFYLLAMIERQIRLLIQIKTGPDPKIAPFQVGKFKRQASKWTLNELLNYHHSLLQLEMRQKTGQARLSLERDLTLLCYNQKIIGVR